MAITLSSEQVDRAIASPALAIGLRKYLWIQDAVNAIPDCHASREFRRRFNGFYRVRRGESWQTEFFGLMPRARAERLDFRSVLDQLRATLGRFEASFASKLVATLDPSKPVIDAFVLKNLGLRLPLPGTANRAERICSVYDVVVRQFAEFAELPVAAYLVSAFHKAFPDAQVTQTKMIDLVLWQTRS